MSSSWSVKVPDRMNGIGPSNWMSRDDRSRNEGPAAPAPQARQPDVNNDGLGIEGIGGGDPSTDNWYNNDGNYVPYAPRQIDFGRADAATSAAAEAMADLGGPPQWEEARRATRSDAMQENAPSTLQMMSIPESPAPLPFQGAGLIA